MREGEKGRRSSGAVGSAVAGAVTTEAVGDGGSGNGGGGGGESVSGGGRVSLNLFLAKAYTLFLQALFLTLIYCFSYHNIILLNSDYNILLINSKGNKCQFDKKLIGLVW